MTAPDAVYATDRWLVHVTRYGVACDRCDAAGSPADTDRWLDLYRHDPEPCPWVCQACETCGDCGTSGHEAGTPACPWEVAG